MNFLQVRLINRLLRNPVPERIPRSGERALAVDCALVYLRSKGSSWTLLVREISNEDVSGKYWHGDNGFGYVTIPFSSLRDYDFDITHFYGPYDLKYSSITDYFFNGIVPLNKTKILLGKVDQFLFNKKELLRAERIEVLKLILERTIDEKDFSVSPTSLLSILHTLKWMFHPDQERQLRHSTLLLKSLHSSEDLFLDNYSYKLSEKALITISNYEEETKKHEENIAQSKAMKYLTGALIFVGLIQVITTIYVSK